MSIVESSALGSRATEPTVDRKVSKAFKEAQEGREGWHRKGGMAQEGFKGLQQASKNIPMVSKVFQKACKKLVRGL